MQSVVEETEADASRKVTEDYLAELEAWKKQSDALLTEIIKTNTAYYKNVEAQRFQQNSANQTNQLDQQPVGDTPVADTPVADTPVADTPAVADPPVADTPAVADPPPNTLEANQRVNNTADAIPFQAAGDAGQPFGQLGGFYILDQHAQTLLIHRHGGYEVKLAPFWKRTIAEAIDMFILIAVNVIVIYFMVDNSYKTKKLKQAKNVEYAIFSDVLNYFFGFAGELNMVQIATQLCIASYEAAWTVRGASPGKAIMKLRIQFVEAVFRPERPHGILWHLFPIELEPVHALIYPYMMTDYKRAFIRSLCKHAFMIIYCPAMVTLLACESNRTPYDVVLKTVVVEVTEQPPLMVAP